MNNKAKNYLSQSQLNAIVKNAFNEDYISTPLNQGTFNMIYDVKLESGKEIILKVAPTQETIILSYEENIIKTEVEMMQYVKENTNVSVPDVYLYDDSKTICNSNYFLREKVSGNSFLYVRDKMQKPQQDEILFKMGKCNKKINDLIGTYYGYPGVKELQGATWKEAFFKMLKKSIEDAQRLNVNLFAPYEYIIEICKSKLYVLEDVKKPHLVHWDLWDGNVIINNNSIAGIIDFERSLWGDYLMEYYFHEIVNTKYNTSYCSGYGKTVFSQKDIIKRTLYNIYMFSVMLIDYINRNLNDLEYYSWAKHNLLENISRLK